MIEERVNLYFLFVIHVDIAYCRYLIVVYRHLTKDYRLNYAKCKKIINEVYLTILIEPRETSKPNLSFFSLSLFITPLIPLISIDDYRYIDNLIG